VSALPKNQRAPSALGEGEPAAYAQSLRERFAEA